MFKNYFKPTPKKLLKLSLAMKATLGSSAIGALANGKPTVATIILLLGAFLDFLIDLQKDDDDDRTGRPGSYVERVKILFPLIGFSVLFASCSVTKHKANRTTDIQAVTSNDSLRKHTSDSIGVKRNDSNSKAKKTEQTKSANDSNITTVTERKIETKVFVSGDTTDVPFTPGKDTIRLNLPHNNILIYPGANGQYILHLVNKGREVKAGGYEKQTKTGDYKNTQDQQSHTEEQHNATSLDSTWRHFFDSVSKVANANITVHQDTGTKDVDRKPSAKIFIVCFLILIAFVAALWLYVRWRKNRLYKNLEQAKQKIYGNQNNNGS